MAKLEVIAENLAEVLVDVNALKDLSGLSQTFPRNNDFLLFFPGQDEGTKLAEWLREHHPESKALFAGDEL